MQLRDEGEERRLRRGRAEMEKKVAEAVKREVEAVNENERLLHGVTRLSASHMGCSFEVTFVVHPVTTHP